jgi:hypothetical protein
MIALRAEAIESQESLFSATRFQNFFTGGPVAEKTR